MFLVDFASLTEHKDYLDFNFSFFAVILIKFTPVYLFIVPMTENLSISVPTYIKK